MNLRASVQAACPDLLCDGILPGCARIDEQIKLGFEIRWFLGYFFFCDPAG